MIQPGEKITFVVMKRTRHGCSFSVRNGFMVENRGKYSKVRHNNGWYACPLTETIRLAGKTNALAEAVIERFNLPSKVE